MYQAMIASASARIFRSVRGTRMRRRPSSFKVRMNRSMTAMLPYWPTAPKRGLILRRRHHRLNALHQNCGPLSEMMYLALAPVSRIVLARKALTCLLFGCFRKTAMPITFREK